MLFYLVGLSTLLTFFIFRSVGIDYRYVAIGSLLPVLIDVLIGRPLAGHAFIFPVVLLVGIMLVTIPASRLLRRKLLCIPIGVFWTLILQGTFMFNYLWFWPFSSEDQNYLMSLFPSFGFWILRDIVGMISIYILFSIGELYKKEKLDVFLKTGRISPT